MISIPLDHEIIVHCFMSPGYIAVFLGLYSLWQFE